MQEGPGTTASDGAATLPLGEECREVVAVDEAALTPSTTTPASTGSCDGNMRNEGHLPPKEDCSLGSAEVPGQLTPGLFRDDEPQQLQAGLYEEDLVQTGSQGVETAAAQLPAASIPSNDTKEEAVGKSYSQPAKPPVQGDFDMEETFFIFDWDDTILPSSWVQRQGLRLDAASQLNVEQRVRLAEVAAVAGKTLRAARQHGTVVLVTNAERGWIELSCQKFLPTLLPMLENVKLVSARTTYEHPNNRSPKDWKLQAFQVEITSYFGAEAYFDVSRRKNVLSLGDSIHEREALLRATAAVPSCLAKSLKFVERPDIQQICKQHELIASSFSQIVHHQENLVGPKARSSRAVQGRARPVSSPA